jgi:hypothetical protein
MARVKGGLAGLATTIGDGTELPPGPPATAPLTGTVTAARPPSKTHPPKPASQAQAARAEPGDRPRYLALQRKETRLRSDQVDSLIALRRRVTGARTRKTERITDNTLVRVAIDLLLANGHRLAGDTEDELLESLDLH